MSDRGSGRIYGRGDLKWKDRELRLVTGRLLATVEPDTKWAGMYRVRLPDGPSPTWSTYRALRTPPFPWRSPTSTVLKPKQGGYGAP